MSALPPDSPQPPDATLAADSPGPVALLTERLRLRPLLAHDIDALHLLWMTPQVRGPLFHDQLIARSWLEAEVQASAQSFLRRGFGQWVLRTHAEDALLGFIGLRFAHDPPALHLVGAVDPDCWGHGFAAEAGHAVLGYSLGQLGLERVLAQATAHNTRALLLMERLGMSYARRHEVAGLRWLTYALERAHHRPPHAPARVEPWSLP